MYIAVEHDQILSGSLPGKKFIAAGENPLTWRLVMECNGSGFINPT
jgi:hypothetical protein